MLLCASPDCQCCARSAVNATWKARAKKVLWPKKPRNQGPVWKLMAECASQLLIFNIRGVLPALQQKYAHELLGM